MNLNFELSEKDLRELIALEIQQRTGMQLKVDQILIEVKSKQNYKSEWESASFRARFSNEI